MEIVTCAVCGEDAPDESCRMVFLEKGYKPVCAGCREAMEEIEDEHLTWKGDGRYNG